MAQISQKKAAEQFAKKWSGRGAEQKDDRTFWLQLLMDVFRVSDPFSIIEFQKPVKMESSTRFIDAYMKETRVLIEQKGVDVDLSKKYHQSGGDELTPYEQARRYDQWMLPDEHPFWIVVCNFKSFEIHDMKHPFDEPIVVLLENLAEEYHRLSFITDAQRVHLQREQKVSMEAGEIVGRIYDALLKQYVNPEDELTKKSLNVLCVRIVFCLYAEDAGIFAKDQFHDYMQRYDAEDLRDALLKLFEVLDTPEDKRSPYLKDVLKAFPYTNGGLFHERDIEVPQFTEGIKRVLVEHASDDFDWSAISPTIFGAVFESTLNSETRRKGGMHYTSIENIHKVIDPLFLDELKEELQVIKDNGRTDIRRRKLKEFQQKLASLKFLDPACGSGNFLTETYLSLRRLENEVIREGLDGNMVFDFDEDVIKVQISQFYGIEINDFAADVARTALWISEAQMMDETRNIIQRELDFLPLKSNSNIVTGNALRLDWNSVVNCKLIDYCLGNPPFIGGMLMNESQKREMRDIFGDLKGVGELDYVGAWYRLAANYFRGTGVRCAFVSSNSICQGEQVAILWERLREEGIVIDFGYRTFQWDSEASAKAHVHCVIVGFSYKGTPQKYIFEGDRVRQVTNINGYLLDAADVFIHNQGIPLCDVPAMNFGNMPRDGGGFILSDEEREELVRSEPLAAKWIHPFPGASEFLNNRTRWCLWLQGASPSELRQCPKVLSRIELVRKVRLDSKAASTRKMAQTPTLFAQITQSVGEPFILVPRVTSGRRLYVPMAFFDGETVSSDSTLIIPNAGMYHFGVLESFVHMAWMRTVCGRLKSDYRYSKDIVYNNFPWPSPSEDKIRKIEESAQSILDARALYPESSLADIYDDLAMPPELHRAHRANDAAVMEAYGFRKDMTEAEIVAELFKLYEKLVTDRPHE